MSINPRIYHPTPLQPNTKVELSTRATNHCLKVLRLRQDHLIDLFCSDGYTYPSTLDIDKKRAFAHIHDKVFVENESPLKIHLGQGLARNDRMDWIIQKAVECGVNEFTPLICEKSLVKLKDDRLDKKIQHWQNIVIAACEQSGRNILPRLNPPQKLDAWLSTNDKETLVCFVPNAQKSVKDIEPNLDAKVLLGPESGFSPKEMQRIEQQALCCHLGPRVLRTETATVAAIVAMQTTFGDFK